MRGNSCYGWKNLLHELGLMQKNFVLYCDNYSAIYLNKHHTFHSRSKHIEVKYQWIQDAIKMKSFVVKKIYINDNMSNMMTKSLPKKKFEFCRRQTGLVEPTKLKLTNWLSLRRIPYMVREREICYGPRTILKDHTLVKKKRRGLSKYIY